MAKWFPTSCIFFIFFWPVDCTKITPDYNNSEKYFIRDGWVPQQQTHAKYIVSLADLRKFSLDYPSTFGQGHVCGGCIIGLQTILTAAHCIYRKNPNNFAIIAGTPIRTQKVETTQIHYVKEMKVHEDYNKLNQLNDIGVIQLYDKLVEDYQTVQRIYIAPETYAVPGQLCLLVGWGRLQASIGALSEVLQYVVLRVYDTNSCDAWLPMPIESTFCAFDPTGNKGSGGLGDSGGPFFCRGRLAGVVSMVHPGFTSSPTHFTKVNKYIEWIRANTIDDIDLYAMRSSAQRRTGKMIILKISIGMILFVHFWANICVKINT